jgi:hypothetical protein
VYNNKEKRMKLSELQSKIDRIKRQSEVADPEVRIGIENSSYEIDVVYQEGELDGSIIIY